MLDTNIYKSEFQNMLRKKGASIQALKEGNNGVTNGYIIPGRDMGLFHEAMERDCLFRSMPLKSLLTGRKAPSSLSIPQAQPK